jgi:hypothetical protein
MFLHVNRHRLAEGGDQGRVECHVAFTTLTAQTRSVCARQECEAYHSVVKGSDDIFLGSARESSWCQKRSEKRESIEEDRSPNVIETRNRIQDVFQRGRNLPTKYALVSRRIVLSYTFFQDCLNDSRRAHAIGNRVMKGKDEGKLCRRRFILPTHQDNAPKGLGEIFVVPGHGILFFQDGF